MEMTLVFGASQHQSQHALALANGLRTLGVSVHSARKRDNIQSECVACWGWHTGAFLRRKGHHVLVLERGYIGDRFTWTSLAWDGLNGYGSCPSRSAPHRFAKYFEQLLKPARADRGEYSLVIGQVPRDASLRGKDMRPWYVERAQEAQEVYGLPVFFRPHPRAHSSSYTNHIPMLRGSLGEALERAHAVITYNSNTAVESVLAGVRTVACDRGSMAWEVAGHHVGAEGGGDRRVWAERLAWRQWLVGEISDGTALRVAMEGLL